MTYRLRKMAAAVALFSSIASVSYSQTVNIKNAINLFDKGDYASATAELEAALERNERDAKTNYYLGASYVCQRRNVSEASRRLKFAQMKGFVANSNFYLGRAYQLNFEFELAQQAFDKFLKTAKDPQLIEQANVYRQQCTNSISLASKIFKVRVIDKYRVSPDSLLSVYNPSREVGAVQRNSDFFESDIDPNGILYRTERGDAVYFSMPNGDGKDNLYKIERLLDGWGDSTPLAGITSDANDRMPVLMTDGTTLYFSSDREGGMGGFDIYRTTYDAETRTFTEPVNMGVPFNSSADDYLFVGDEFRQRAWFASNRETSADSLMVYEILWDESVIRSFAQSTEEIRQASALAVDASLANMRDNMAVAASGSKAAYSITNEQKKFSFALNDSLTYSQWEHFRSDAARQKYREAYQLTHNRDSLSAEMANKRRQFMQLSSDDERNKLITEILTIERTMYTLEDQADEASAEARRMELQHIQQLVASGQYIPFRQMQQMREEKKRQFDWAKLLRKENFEMYSPVLFDDVAQENANFYNSVFAEGERADLIKADSLLAWSAVLKLEANKLIEKGMNGERISTIDENGKTVVLTPQEVSQRGNLFMLASMVLYNMSHDRKFDIFDDRYSVAVDSEPEIDFAEVDEHRNAAVHDFELVENVSARDGVQVLEKAGVMKRRGIESYTAALKRYADHANGTFPLPKRKAPTSEPESVVMALANTDASNAKRGDAVATISASVVEEAVPAPVVVEEPMPEAVAPTAQPSAEKQAPAVTEFTDATAAPVDGKPVYRIQLGVFRNKPAADKLAIFNKVTTQHIADKGLTKYFGGEYPKYAEAVAQVETVRQTGFAGAFVVAFVNGEQVKLAVAQKME